MPAALPAPEDTDLVPPSAEEAFATAEAMASVVAPAGGLTPFQQVLLEAIYAAMTGHAVDSARFASVGPERLGEVLARRNLAFRTRGVQVMLLLALVLRPLPADVVARIAAGARELGVDEGMIDVAREFAAGSLGLAAVDFERNGYTASWRPSDAATLHTSAELRSAWDLAVDDPTLAARWDGLGALPAGTLGRLVWQMYRARGFEFPGRPGSAPPLLAQHDWVHVLADYGTTVDNELEVFAFIARANDDMAGFSLLAMVVSLFETGFLASGAGLFQADPGHLSVGEGMAIRVADAMRRGALCTDRAGGSDSVDFLRVDWFTLASLPVEEARERFRVRPKSERAVAAGSVGPWQHGGISPFQARAGRAMAERDGRAYDGYGAGAGDPTPP